MTYIVAVIEDDTFDEPHVILGVSEEQVATAVAVYLRTARPMTPSGRLELSDPPESWRWKRHLDEALADVDDVTVTWYSTERGSILPVGSFLAWIEQNRDALERQHRAPVENVVDNI